MIHYNIDSTNKAPKALCERKNASKKTKNQGDVTCKKCENRLCAQDERSEREAYNTALYLHDSHHDSDEGY